MWGGFTMDFELIGNAEDAFASIGAGGDAFSAANTATNWSIQDIRITGDVVTLDSALQNSYAEHVLSGKSLPINYGTYITMQQTVVGSEIRVNISRAVSRLKTSFCSFDEDFNPTDAQKVKYPYYLVKLSFFFHPMGKRASDASAAAELIYDFKKEL